LTDFIQEGHHVRGTGQLLSLLFISPKKNINLGKLNFKKKLSASTIAETMFPPFYRKNWLTSSRA